MVEIQVRPRRLRRLVASVFLGWAAAAVWFGAGEAKASPAADYAAANSHRVCAVLEMYPTVGGVVGLVEAVVDEGWDAYTAGRIIGLAVTDECPEFWPVLDEFISWSQGRPVMA